MKKAVLKDRSLVVDILSRSFDDNKSVNYIIQQDHKRKERIRRLMAYSFDMCYYYGRVFLSDDNNACALILQPDLKKTTLKTIWWDIQLILFCIGLSNIKKAMQRETRINKLHPTEPFFYLWFIGVEPKQQNLGIGSKLLREIFKQSNIANRPIYLETSTLKNIPWYQKFGFTIYHEMDFGYTLFFLKRETQ